MAYVQSETPYLWKGLSCALGFFVMSTGLALCQSLHGRVNGNGAANARTVLTSAVYNKVRHTYGPHVFIHSHFEVITYTLIYFDLAMKLPDKKPSVRPYPDQVDVILYDGSFSRWSFLFAPRSVEQWAKLSTWCRLMWSMSRGFATIFSGFGTRFTSTVLTMYIYMCF